MPNNCPTTRFLFPVALLVLTSSSIAMAGLSRVGFGLKFPQPLGSFSQKVDPSVGFDVDVLFDRPTIASQTDIIFRGIYQPFQIKNFSGTTLNTWSLLGGLETHGKGAAFGIQPTFSVLIGGAYASYAYSGASSSTANSNLYFTTQIGAGIAFPIYGSLTGMLDLPVTFVFAKPVFTTWNQVVSLRWAL